MTEKPTADHDIWTLFTRDITPLRKNDRILFSAPVPRKKKSGLFSSHSVIHPHTPQKRGEKNIYIEGQIDLHGMTENSAYFELSQFIRLMRAHKHKWGLVITGKSGVLFEMVPKWLVAMQDDVSFFCHARPLHGGTGALYIKLY